MGFPQRGAAPNLSAPTVTRHRDLFEEIVRLGVKVGVLDGSVPFERYTDARFSQAVTVSPTVTPLRAEGAP